MKRRKFLKILGMGVAAVAIAPRKVFSKVKYWGFKPGETYRNAVKFRGDGTGRLLPLEGPGVRGDEILTGREEVMQFGMTDRASKRLLVDWLREKVPPNYLDTSKMTFDSEIFDFGHMRGISIRYVAPLKPIRGGPKEVIRGKGGGLIGKYPSLPRPKRWGPRSWRRDDNSRGHAGGDKRFE